MKNNFRIYITSLILAFLVVFLFSSFSGEISFIGLFPGFMLNWLIGQLLIEILNEPYFILGDFSFALNLLFYFTVLSFVSKVLLTISNDLLKSKSKVLR